jgi:hypothetical protein
MGPTWFLNLKECTKIKIVMFINVKNHVETKTRGSLKKEKLISLLLTSIP